MFVTLQCLVFDLAAGTVTCASAGHHGAPSSSPRRAAPARLHLVGTRPRACCRPSDVSSETLALQPGDTFVLFTDGVSEAFDPDEELFGDERLLGTCGPRRAGARARRRSASSTRCAVTPPAPKQSDDITVVSVRNAGRA